MLPPNLPNLPTKIKYVRAQLVALLIMEDDECSLIYAKMNTPNIFKMENKLTYVTYPLK
jgi:hypothetical protein